MPLDDPPEVLTRDFAVAEFVEQIAMFGSAVLLIGLAGFMWNEAARHHDAVPVALLISLFPPPLFGALVARRRLVVDHGAGTAAVQLVLTGFGLPIGRRHTIDLSNLEAVAVTPIHQKTTIWRIALVHDQGNATTLARRHSHERADAEAQVLADELGLAVRSPPP